MAYILDGNGGGRVIEPDGVHQGKKAQGVLWARLDLRGADTPRWLATQSGLGPLVVAHYCRKKSGLEVYRQEMVCGWCYAGSI